MACNTCFKTYSIFRKEKACPSCGFSYCSKCLEHKIFVEKLKSEAKVCVKCARNQDATNKVEPPDAYFNRIEKLSNNDLDNTKTEAPGLPGTSNHPLDKQLHERLKNLKKEPVITPAPTSDDEIRKRLKNINTDIPTTSNAEIEERLSKLRGVPSITNYKKDIFPAADLRSEQQQADDLMKQYLEQTAIDSKYKEDFDGAILDIESRLQKIKSSGDPSSAVDNKTKAQPEVKEDSEDEEELIKKILERVKAESIIEDDPSSPNQDELPFCEICNEDAKLRCLGCHYLFCKRCFSEHKDDDDGCHRYESYTPPKSALNK